MTEVEFKNKILDDDIVVMFTSVKTKLPEGDMFAAFEKGVKIAETFYKKEMESRSFGATKLLELAQLGRIKGMEVEEQGDGKFLLRDTLNKWE